MKKAIVVGGSNGIGLAITVELSNLYEEVTIIDRVSPSIELSSNVGFRKINLLNEDFGFLSDYNDIDSLIITAGFGRVTPFSSIVEKEIDNSFQVNTIATTKILHHYYPRMQRAEDFHCAVMGSIAGFVSSPLFALYGATKAALCSLIESLNVELEKSGTINRILNV